MDSDRMTKARLLLALARSRPGELADRTRTFLEARRDRRNPREAAYAGVPWDEAVTRLEEEIDAPLGSLVRESGADEVERIVTQRTALLQSLGPFRLSHNADLSFGRLIYGLCRAVKPEVVVETGTGYGVTTSFILAALSENGTGRLHSVDLPPLAPEADLYVGWLIPDDLRTRWSLHRGSSRRILPGLLKELPSIDVFLHDSLHTYGHMRWEFQQVEPHLSERALVLVDDAVDNAAFAEWSLRPSVTFSSLVAVTGRPLRSGVSTFRRRAGG